MTPPTMGITHARVVLHSIDMARKEVCDLLVDTGSTLSWVPEEVAARVGIQATEVRTFRLADGREVERPVGEAILEAEGLRGATRIVFARPGDGSLLGLHALEGLGLEVDPGDRTLRRTDAFLAFATSYSFRGFSRSHRRVGPGSRGPHPLWVASEDRRRPGGRRKVELPTQAAERYHFDDRVRRVILPAAVVGARGTNMANHLIAILAGALVTSIGAGVAL